MLRCGALLGALVLSLSLGAQTNNSRAVAISDGIHVSSLNRVRQNLLQIGEGNAVLNANQSAAVLNNSSFTLQNVGTFAVTPMGTSPHPYTILYARNHQFVYDPDLDLMVFIHRNNTYRYGGPTGHFRIDVSYDRGVTWDSDIGPITQLGGGSVNPRYPEVLIYNPAGNTDPTQAYAVYIGYYHNGSVWQGITYGIVKVDGSYISPQKLLPINNNYLPESYFGTSGLSWIYRDTFMVLTIDWLSDVGRKIAVLKGWIINRPSGLEDTMVIGRVIPITGQDTVDPFGSFNRPIGTIEFAFDAKPNGVGVIVGLSDRTIENPEDTALDVLRPFIFYTLDGGQTWIDGGELHFYNHLSTAYLGDSLVITDNLGNPVDTLYPSSWTGFFDIDVIIDEVNRAHIIFPVAWGYSYNILYQAGAGIIDVVYDLNLGAIDTVIWIDSINALYPWNDGETGTDLDYVNQRIQASRSAWQNGRRIGITWIDDPTAQPVTVYGNNGDLHVAYIDYDPVTDRYTLSQPTYIPSQNDPVWGGNVAFQQVAIPMPGEDCGTGYVAASVAWLYGAVNANPGDTVQHYYWNDSRFGGGAPLFVIDGRLADPTNLTAYVSCNGSTDGWFKVIVPNLPAGMSVGVEINVGGTWIATDSVGNLPPGNYPVKVYYTTGCGDTAYGTVTILEPTPLVVNLQVLVQPTSPGSADGALSAAVTGGVSPYTFTWSTGLVSSSPLLTNVDTGWYWVIVTDTLGCSDTDSVYVTSVCEGFSVSSTVFDVSCYGGSDGAIYLNPSGGNPPYTYQWNDGATTQNRVNIPAGTYTVTVTDALGCTSSLSFTVNQPDSISITYTIDSPTCGNSDGAIYLNVTGGTPPYFYSWSNGGTDSAITNIPAGAYTVTVYDNNGCQKTITIPVSNQNANITITGTVVNVLCNGDTTGAIDITVSGGTPPYSFSWSNGATTEDIMNVPAGTYSVVVTDANGCSATATFTISEPDPLVITLDTIISPSCNAADGSILITVSGGEPPYMYHWSNGSSSEDLVGISAGTYSVTVYDQNGCSATATFQVSTVTGPILDSVYVKHITCYGDSNGAIFLVNIIGGSPPYTYQWGNGSTTRNLVDIPAGTYNVAISDQNGCVTMASITVNEPPALVVTVYGVDDSTGNGSGMAWVVATGGTPPYTYNWSTGSTTDTIRNLTAGTYWVEVIDANGCVASDTVTINTIISVLKPAGKCVLLKGNNVLACESQIVGVSIVDVTGRVIKFYKPVGNNYIILPIKELPVGMYVIIFETTSGYDAVKLQVLKE